MPPEPTWATAESIRSGELQVEAGDRIARRRTEGETDGFVLLVHVRLVTQVPCSPFDGAQERRKPVLEQGHGAGETAAVAAPLRPSIHFGGDSFAASGAGASVAMFMHSGCAAGT
ncbi:hypothetical protein ACLB9X_23025 [Streptomyces sp. 5K101]|uniref:hypothetical protein n=1 Tax=Streptomyces sp. 5K101 TaxID=3390037 RepID=UPI0039749A1F